jgi:hypothetical protein
MLRTSLETIGYQVSTLGADDDDFPFNDFYDILYKKPNERLASNWAEIYDDELPSSAQELIQSHLGNSVVFLFEGSPSILKIIDEIKGVYINFRIHPMRFGSDLIMAIESNDKDIMHRLRQYKMSSEAVTAEITALKARWANKLIDLPRDSLIFLGQTRHDASVIVSGKFMSLTESAESLLAMGSGRPVFHKPHPHDSGAPTLGQWLSIFPNSQEVSSSTYNILAHEKSMEFVTISSGAGYEAEILGHKVNFLNPKNWGRNSQGYTHFVDVFFEYWYTGFWNYVLSSGREWWAFSRSAWRPCASSCFVPDRLRCVIGMEWSER